MDGVLAVVPSDSIGKAIGAATAVHLDESNTQKSPTNVVIGEGAPAIIGPVGLPIVRSGKLEGAIGVSGVYDNEQNAECAKAGVEVSLKLSQLLTPDKHLPDRRGTPWR
jgi:uncharacterized protein GlcG (DUF336 family)